MIALVLYPLITATLFYLGSRAKITEFLWRRYPGALARFMDCAACTGFWYGLLISCFGGLYLNINVGPLIGSDWSTIVLLSLASISWTPIVANWVDLALTSLGTTVPDNTDGDVQNT